MIIDEKNFNDFYNELYNSRNDKSLSLGRVVSEHKEMYIVKNDTNELFSKISGKMMFSSLHRIDYPTTGDYVLIKIIDNKNAIIHEILPRKTLLKRKSVSSSDDQIIAANINAAFIIQSPDRDYNLNRFERYIALLESNYITPIIVLNKTDILSDSDLTLKVSEINNRFKNISFIATSIVEGRGINDLINIIKPKNTYCFLGSSGVGKSSLINIILGKNKIKTAEISNVTERGKHVTTHRELFSLQNGSFVIDNPGMREIGMLDSELGLKNVFSDILELSKNCRYLDCNHIIEPGCAVLDAVSKGILDEEKYKNYLKLMKENEYNNMTKKEKRDKDKKFGKFIKSVKKQIRMYDL